MRKGRAAAVRQLLSGKRDKVVFQGVTPDSCVKCVLSNDDVFGAWDKATWMLAIEKREFIEKHSVK